MRELTVSQPYPDPRQARKMRPDWLIAVRGRDCVQMVRFEAREAADAWLQELADHPELDTDDREFDERRTNLNGATHD